MGIVPFNPMENQPCHAKSSVTLATAATIAVSALASSAADAHGFGGGGFGGGHGGWLRPHGRWLRPHGRWRLRPLGHSSYLSSGPLGAIGITGVDEIIGVIGATIITAGTGPVRRVRRVRRVGAGGGAARLRAPTPGPCTCLTKTYTQDGLVVFADLCTKEWPVPRLRHQLIRGGAADRARRRLRKGCGTAGVATHRSLDDFETGYPRRIIAKGGTASELTMRRLRLAGDLLSDCQHRGRADVLRRTALHFAARPSRPRDGATARSVKSPDTRPLRARRAASRATSADRPGSARRSPAIGG